MFFDGSMMKTGAGAGLLFISPLGMHLRYVLRLHFPASNNVAEYEALVNGLRIAIELGVRLLRRGSAPGGQVLRARGQPRRPAVQRDCGRAGEDSFGANNVSPERLLPGPTSTLSQDKRHA
jgi:hypothetical protein